REYDESCADRRRRRRILLWVRDLPRRALRPLCAVAAGRVASPRHPAADAARALAQPLHGNRSEAQGIREGLPRPPPPEQLLLDMRLCRSCALDADRRESARSARRTEGARPNRGALESRRRGFRPARLPLPAALPA